MAQLAKWQSVMWSKNFLQLRSLKILYRVHKMRRTVFDMRHMNSVYFELPFIMIRFIIVPSSTPKSSK